MSIESLHSKSRLWSILQPKKYLRERDGAEVDEGALDDEGVEVGTTVEGVNEGALDEEGVEVGTAVEGVDEGALDEEGVVVGTAVEGVDEGALDEEGVSDGRLLGRDPIVVVVIHTANNIKY